MLLTTEEDMVKSEKCDPLHLLSFCIICKGNHTILREREVE